MEKRPQLRAWGVMRACGEKEGGEGRWRWRREVGEKGRRKGKRGERNWIGRGMDREEREGDGGRGGQKGRMRKGEGKEKERK